MTKLLNYSPITMSKLLNGLGRVIDVGYKAPHAAEQQGWVVIDVYDTDEPGGKVAGLDEATVNKLIAMLVSSRDIAYPKRPVPAKDKTMSPQAKIVLSHLKKHGAISAVEAAAVYKVRSLSRRVNDIESFGYVIDRTFKVDATKQRYVSYSLVI
jgi:hypothetical protein